MDKYIIEANFHVFVAQGEGVNEKKAVYSKGMVIEESEIPAGQSADDWIAKGLAKAA